MAEWKKLVVSGSSISQLDNDANYVASTGGGIVSGSEQVTMGGDLSGPASNAQIVAGAVGSTELASSAVTNAKLGADSVNGAKIADNSIDSEHYVDGSIDAAHLASNAVTTVKINALAVTEGKLAANSVTTAKIVDSNVTNAKLATNAVTTVKITDSNVTNAKLANDSITIAGTSTALGGSISAATILTGTDVISGSAGITMGGDLSGPASNAQIVAGAVGTTELAADAVTGAKIADNAIDSEHYVDGSIDQAHLAANSVTTFKIVDSNVTTAKLATDAVTTVKITDSNVTNAKLANDSITIAGTSTALGGSISAATILTGTDVISGSAGITMGGDLSGPASNAQIVAGAVGTTELGADAVTGAKIADNAIDSEHYVDGSIDAAHLASNAVTTVKINALAVTEGKLAANSVTTAKIVDSNVTNAKLANSSITVGDSVISLGGTDTTLTGLTDIDMTSGDKTILDGIGANTLTIGATTTTSSFAGQVTIGGDLIVEGSRTELQVTDLAVEDRFILLASGSAAGEDAGLVVGGDGSSFGWDSDIGRWAFDFEGALAGQSDITPDAYAVAVTSGVAVGSADSNYEKNGNILVDTSGDLWMYSEV